MATRPEESSSRARMRPLWRRRSDASSTIQHARASSGREQDGGSGRSSRSKSSGDGSATSWSPAAARDPEDIEYVHTGTVGRNRYLCNALRYKRAAHPVRTLMIVDGRTVTQDDVLRFDVCVIGAGPAGMLVASQLAGKGVRVSLLERGDDDSGRGRTHTARNAGIEYDVGQSRGFGLGGTANKWDLHTPWGDRLARFRELDEADFAPRDWVPHSGWPFRKSELRPFYDLAWSLLGCPPGFLDALCSHGTGPNPFQDHDGIVQQCLFVLASPLFAERLRADLAGSASATVLTNSTAVDIRCDASASHVSSVGVATQGSKGFSVDARVFILAAGGIENARMLLASRSRHSEGVGNGHGLVGRFFMEHPLFVSGVLHPKDFSAFDDPTSFDSHLHDDIVVRMSYALHEDVIRRERLLRSYFVFERFFLNARVRRIYASEFAARSLRAAANVRATLMGRANGVVEIPLRRLGSQAPTISVIGYGAWEAGSTEWGAAPPDAQVVQAMITAFETGVTWIDTAEIYGSGRSEELVAKAIKTWPDIKIFTKVASAPRGSGYRPC